jgi:hypothetical protein
MMAMDPIVNMYKLSMDIKNFYKLTDSYVIEIIKFLDHYKENVPKLFPDVDPELAVKTVDYVNKLWIELSERKLYYHVKTFVLQHDVNNITVDKFIEMDSSIDPKSIIIHKSKLGFVSGNKGNPFDNLYFYTNKKPNECLKIPKEEVTFLIPDTYQEYIYMVFVKDRDNKSLIDKMENICEHII